MNNQNNWYTTFFNGLALDLWNNAIPKEATDLEINFIKNIAALKPGARILDVPCGSGRHCIPLAIEGYSVTGIDLSGDNISGIRKIVAEKNIPLEAIRADILEYSIHGLFDLAICLGNSFAYFPSDKMSAFVMKIQKALKPGSKFIINTGSIAESIMPNLEHKDWYEMGGLFFMFENTYLAGDSVLRSDMIFVKGEKIERKTAYHFVYTLAEVKGMLTKAGFRDIQVYNGLEKSEYKFGDQQAYIVAGN